MVLVEIIFWFSISLIIYSTIFYPVLLSFIRSNIYVVDEKFIPEVSLIISAYNEEKNILKKLRNIDDLDYPKEKLQVILVKVELIILLMSIHVLDLDYFQ